MRKQRKQKKQRKRINAALLCICMLLCLVSAPVSAAETGEKAGSHKHTSDCYIWTEKCVHEHTPECYPQTDIAENEASSSNAVEPTECGHICSEESGCITKELNCHYDGENTPITVKAPQEKEAIATLSNARKVSALENVQAMINALPDVKDINNNNVEEVRTQFKAVEDAMIQLSVEDSVVLDIARYLKVVAALYGPFYDIPNPILGTDIKWVISRDNRTLTISGEGEMPDFENRPGKRCPWEDKKSGITKVIIEEGVTTIGSDAFNGCKSLSEVHIPKTVKKIGTSAFCGCTILGQIDIPSSVKEVMPYAFAECPGLKQVHTHWKDPSETDLAWAFYIPINDSWPEDRIIYVPDAYKDRFVSGRYGLWGDWNVEGETYTVSFDGDGAPGYMRSIEDISGDYILPESGFTYETAILDYWALDNPEGEKAGCPGDIFPVTEDVVFYASWRLVIVIPDPEIPVVCLHVWGEWQSDGDRHWKKCSNCDAIGQEAEHWWDDGKVTIQPTCTTAGQKIYTCTVCSLTKPERMDARGHNFVYHSGKAATCTEEGWSAYGTCTKCDYTTYAELPALGHDPIHHDAKAATCTEKGWNVYETCTRCDYTTYAELPALGHDFSVRQHNETQHWKKCSRCEADDAREDHSGGTATCKDKAVCATCNTAYGELNMDNHTGGTEVRGRVEATTSAAGYTGDTYCKGCGTRIAEGQAIPKEEQTITKKDSGSSSGGGNSTYYTMNFHTNGGGSISAIGGTYGKTINLFNYIPTRAGYDFTGWYSDQGLTQKITEIKLNSSRTVYAGWIKSDPNARTSPFIDVYVNDWFYNDVMFVYEKGLMSGISATTFAPYTNITRAQIAAIFYRMEGSPAVEGKNNFTDVEYGPGTVWFYDAVTWAQQNGIMGECGGNKFAPDDPVTREQLASIFYRYAQIKGYDTAQNGLAADSASRDPKGNVTRAETAAMLKIFIEKQGLQYVVTPAGTIGWAKPMN